MKAPNGGSSRLIRPWYNRLPQTAIEAVMPVRPPVFTPPFNVVRASHVELTVREQEVMAHIVRGLLNKQTAAALGISEITVKVHRRHIMQKMCVRSLAELVRLSEKLA